MSITKRIETWEKAWGSYIDALKKLDRATKTQDDMALWYALTDVTAARKRLEKFESK